MTAEPADPLVERSVPPRLAGGSPPELTAEPGEGEVVAALLAAWGRGAAGSRSDRPVTGETEWRRVRLAALGMLPRFRPAEPPAIRRD